MIRFRCIYCGERILAPDNSGGKKGKCPKCRHELRVPISTKGRPAVAFDNKEEISEKLKENASFKMPPMTAYDSLPQDDEDELAELVKERAGWLIPVYDELSLFLMAIMLVILYGINSDMRREVNDLALKIKDPRLYVFLLIFFAGFVLSVYHVFSKREKSTGEKWIMLIFAVAANAATGIAAGVYLIQRATDWTIIFPFWNLINAVLLIVMLRYKIVDEECISDRDATATEVLIGFIAVIIIFIFCNFVFKLHWSITYSICIVYTTSFDRAMQNVFPGFYRPDDAKDEIAA